MSPRTIGRFELISEIGRGNMGVVYKAHDPVLDRLAAIKLINTGGEVDEELKRRFLVEARSAARLSHASIVAIYDFGEHNNCSFIAMEYVDGEDLKTIIKRRRFFRFKDKLRIVQKICEGLDYAHANDVIHRDIKPANVLVTSRLDVKILDFGLARIASSEMTRTGQILGTPYYMSPEQVLGSKEVDGRSDLFSVGVLLYEFLSYNRPFEAETPTAVCFKIAGKPPTPIRDFLPYCDPELCQILNRCLAKQPGDRFPTCGEVANALSNFTGRIPDVEKEVSGVVEHRQRELERRRDTFQAPELQGLADDSLFDITAPLPDSNLVPPLEAGPRDDYGNLLLQAGLIEERFTILQDYEKQAEKVLSLYRQAEAHLNRGELTECQTRLNEIFRIHRDNRAAQSLEGQLESQLEDRERRLYLEALVASARRALDQNRSEDCLRAAEEVLRIDPDHGEAIALRNHARQRLETAERLQRLQEAALRDEKTGDLEKALAAVNDGLQIDPQNIELKAIADRLSTGLEKRARIEHFLASASRQLEEKQFDQARESVAEILRLEPDNSRALNLKRRADQAAAAQRQLQELVRQAKESAKGEDFDKAGALIGQALVLDPENQELESLRRNFDVQLGRQARVRTLLALVRAQLYEEKYVAAKESVRELLELAPRNQEALRLQNRISAAIRLQEQADTLLAAARSAENERDWEACRKTSEEGLALLPGHTEFVRLQRRAIEETARLTKIAALLKRGRAEMDAGRYEPALEHIGALLVLQPGHREALELQKAAKDGLARQVEREARIRQLWKKAEQASRSGSFSQALADIHQLLELDPQNEEALRLRDRISADLKLQEEAGRLLAAAQSAENEGNWETCRNTSQEALALLPGHPELVRLQRRAVEEIARLTKIETLLEHGRADLDAGRYDRALEHIRTLLSLQPRHREALELQNTARARLTEQRERESRIRELLQKAQEESKSGDFRQSLQNIHELLTLDPDNEEALQLRTALTELLTREERVRNLQSAALKAEREGDLKEGFRLIEEALTLSPSDPDLMKVRERIKIAVEEQEHIATLFRSASSACEQKRFQEARDRLSELLALRKGDLEATTLLQRIETEERRQRVEELLTAGSQLEKSGEYEAALKRIHEARNLDPGNKEIDAALYRIEEALKRQRQVENLLGRIHKQTAAEQFEKALASVEQLLRIAPGHAEAPRLKQAAEYGLRRIESIARLSEEASSAAKQGDWQTCFTKADDGLRLAPHDPRLKQLHEQAGNELDRLQKIGELLRQAQDAEREQDWVTCARKAQEGLELASKDERFQNLLTRADQKLKHEAQVRELLAQVRAAFEKEDYDLAAKWGNALLEIAPGHDEGLRLVAEAKRKLELKDRVGKLLAEALDAAEHENHRGCFLRSGLGLRLDPENQKLQRLHARAAEALSDDEKVSGLFEQAKEDVANRSYSDAVRELKRLLIIQPKHRAARIEYFRAKRLSPHASLADFPRLWAEIAFDSIPTRGLWLVAAILLVGIGVAVYRLIDFNPSPVPAAASLAVNATPWAEIKAIERVSDGKSLVGEVNEKLTPCVLSLPAGRYRIKLANPSIPEPLDFEVDLEAGQRQAVFKRFANFDLESEVSSFLTAVEDEARK